MGERIGVYPGTFDPITLGHADIIGRGAKLVDRLIIGVTTNPSKNPMFSPAERMAMVEREVAALGLTNVEVIGFNALLMKFAESQGASVIIRGHSTEEITKATVAVFQEDGYSVRAVDGKLIFDREASRMNNIAYEGVVGAHYGAQTLERVKAALVEIGADAYRLQCQAYIVKGAGDTFFGEEQKLANIRSRPALIPALNPGTVELALGPVQVRFPVLTWEASRWALFITDQPRPVVSSRRRRR